MVARLDNWDLIHFKLIIDFKNIYKIIVICMICTMAVKVIMVFEWNFFCQFGNSNGNFLITIKLSIGVSTDHNTTTPSLYDSLGPHSRTIFPNQQQNIVQYECKYTSLNGSIWKFMIFNFFFALFVGVIVNFKDLLRKDGDLQSYLING